MFKKEETILHFVGIGGIGMSGIAEVFLNQGHRITGSDLGESESTRKLAKLGAKIAIGHAAENVRGAHVVIVSSAIKPTNPEVKEARRLMIPVIPRAEMLGELMRGKVGIAVAGTHGKTTTTSMLATILTVAGLDPTIVVGGRVDSFGGNAKLGRGNYVVAEADESDGSFLHLPASFGIITNIDSDHLDHFKNLEAIEDAFVDFVAKLPFYGIAMVCGDDPGVVRCMGRWTKPYRTYGLSVECNLFASDVICSGFGSSFKVNLRESQSATPVTLGEIALSVPGKHNVLNALACIGIGLQLEIPFESMAEALHGFRGVKRRFELKWRDLNRNRAIVDDYGHHPVEIAATLDAAKAFWSGRIITVFQPHRYTRTKYCYEGFLDAFSKSDIVLITDIYPAGEDPIPEISAEGLVRDMRIKAGSRQEIHFVKDMAGAKTFLEEIFSDNDLILCLGAGTITRLAEQLPSDLADVSAFSKGPKEN